MDERKNQLLVIFSADGAEHQSTEEGGANIVSYNIIIINQKLQEEGYTSTQSHNILTIKQVAADEKPDLCLSVHEEIVKMRNRFSIDDLPEKYRHIEISFSDMNDGKMIYALLQCSRFNSKFHPYCNFQCKRGDNK